MNEKRLVHGLFLGAWSLLLSLVLACDGAGTASQDGQPFEFGRSRAGLQAGWHLVSTSSTTEISFLQGVSRDRQTLFEVDHVFRALSKQVVPKFRVAKRLRSNRTYWVHVAPKGASVRAEALSPPAGGAEAAEGHFVELAEPTPKERVGEDIYRWAFERQALVAVSSEKILKPGIYWVDHPGACDPGSWFFADAIRLVATCPVEHTPLTLVPRERWSSLGKKRVAEPFGHSPKTLVLHHTGTPQDVDVASWERLERKTKTEAELQFHYIIAKDEAGQWQVYEGRGLGTPLGALAEGGSRDEVHIAVMGTYEPWQPEHAEETAFGYDSGAPEAERQPPAGAVIRLIQLVSSLRAQFTDVEALVPYGQGFDALRPGASLSPGRGALHLAWSLHDRFFVKRDNLVPVHRFETTAQTSHVRNRPQDERGALVVRDRVPPVLFVARPPTAVAYSKTATISVLGEVYDEQLMTFSVNGIVLGQASKSFEEQIWLGRGRNTVRFFAMDASGNTTEVEKHIVYDDRRPRIEVLPPDPQTIAVSSRFGVYGRVVDDSLAELTLNQAPLEVVDGQFVIWFDRGDFEDGFFPFEVVATDAVGHESTAQFGLSFQGGQVRFEPGENTSSNQDEVLFEDPAVGFYLDVFAEQAGTDETVPHLEVKTPPSGTTFTRFERARIEGFVADDNLVMVRVNQVVLKTKNGDFATSVFLKQEETDFKFVAEDAAGNQEVVQRSLILDRDAPGVTLSHVPEGPVYAPEYTILGTIEDRYLEEASLLMPDGEKVVLELDHGRFQKPVNLDAGLNAFTVLAYDRAGNVGAQSIEVFYKTASFVASRPTEPPPLIFGWSQDGQVHLQWEAPRRFADHALIPPGVKPTYRIYRDNVLVQEQAGTRYEESPPGLEATVSFYVVAVVQGKSGPLESGRSDQIEVSLKNEASVFDVGAFESPGQVASSALAASTPLTAVSVIGGKAYTHIVFVDRGDGGERSDQIRYLKSEQLAKRDSWKQERALRTPKSSAVVTDIALSAHGVDVVVAWIETTQEGPDNGSTISEVMAVHSKDGGQSFSSPSPLRTGPTWKRTVDVAVDSQGTSHVVFGEGNKVFYAKNFEIELGDDGEPRGVFDRLMRKPADEKVQYKVRYRPHPERGCLCPHCWCDEDYLLEEEENPETGEPFGPYISWHEDVFVYEPSIAVDNQSVSIVARQRRRFDNVPVLNPFWQTMADEAPVFGDERVVLGRPTKRLVGWRKIYKTRYEPGDEALWPGLGFDAQYLYAGTLHEEESIHLIQRPLNDGALVSASGTWRAGTWVDDVYQDWRRRVMTTIDSTQAANRLSYPKISTSFGGRLVVAYEQGESQDPNLPGHNAIYVARSVDGGDSFGTPERVAEGYMPDVTVTPRGDTAIVYYGVGKAGEGNASIQVMYDAGDGWEKKGPINAARPKFIHERTHKKASDFLYGVPSVTHHEDLLLAAWVRAGQGTGGTDAIMTSRAALAKSTQKSVQLTARATATENLATPVTLECLDGYHMYARGCPGAEEVTLQVGEQTFNNPEGEFDVVATAYVPVGAVGGDATGGAGIALAGSQKGFGRTQDLDVIKSHAGGNYLKASRMRDALYSDEIHAQREFVGDDGNPDSIPLEGFKRAWAYTQGITLAQLARQRDARAGQLARALCEEGQRGIVRGSSADGAPVVKGWHFSWNTELDGFKDFRLVTGATAWTIHGLGVYLASQVERHGHIPKDDEPVARCYRQALDGLKEHRKVVTKNGVSGELVTAGWTAAGLVHADEPFALGLTEDPDERWPYYEVLDAIGYDEYAEARRPPIHPNRLIDDKKVPFGTEPVFLSEAEYRALRVRVQATNVVTEHNLDVLSVLNHAIKHADAFGLDEAALSGWRNRLRDAIFTLLWDDAEKRIITGGEVNLLSELVTNPHTAIDNCSWLSLSVDYTSLPPAQRAQLAECLQYTKDNFVRSIRFEGQAYYGTHYFKNDFKDPYIEESELQEDSYHLEATAGMILGLLYFADANPEHNQAAFFRSEAAHLWADMQLFVREHGFRYSSQRIQDLSTLLESSTAVIWFMDVYEYERSRYSDWDRPLKNYAKGFDVGAARKLVDASWEVLLGAAPVVDDEGQETGERGGPSDAGPARVSGLLVSAELPVTFDAGAFRLATSEEPKTLVTYIQDQALAIVAAVNRGDQVMAARWVDALLSTLHTTPHANGLWSQFPFVVDSLYGRPVVSYHQVATQLKAAYALAWYLKHGADHAEAKKALVEVLQGVSAVYLDHNFGGLFGLLLSGSGRPDVMRQILEGGALSVREAEAVNEALRSKDRSLLPVASVEDHVYAFFALELALEVLEGEADTDTLEALLAQVLGALQGEAFQSEGRVGPIPYASPLGLESGATVASSALYTLFSLRAGSLFDVPTLLTRLSAGIAPKAEAETGAARLAADLFGTDLGVAMARRAGASLEPRQGQLAYAMFAEMASDETPGRVKSVRDASALLLLNHPNGFMGIDAGPIVWGSSGPSIGSGPSSSRPRLAIETRYKEVVLELLTTAFQRDNFDALLQTLAYAHHVLRAIRDGVPPDAWLGAFHFRRALADVVYDLLHACEGQSAELSLAMTVGLDCTVLSAQFEVLLRQRQSSTDGMRLASVLEHPNDAFEMAQLVELYALAERKGASSGLYDSQAGSALSLALVRRAGPVLLPEDPTPVQVQARLHEHYRKVVREGASNRLQRGDALAFEFRGFRWIQSQNPVSSFQGSRILLEYRELLRLGPQVHTLARLHGRPVPGFHLIEDRLVSDPAFGDNPKQFRRLLNNHGDGDLVQLARRLNLDPGVLHATMDRGVLTESDYHKIVEALGLSDALAQDYKALFVLSPVDDLGMFLGMDSGGSGHLSVHETARAGRTDTLLVDQAGPLIDPRNTPEAHTGEIAGLLVSPSLGVRFLVGPKSPPQEATCQSLSVRHTQSAEGTWTFSAEDPWLYLRSPDEPDHRLKSHKLRVAPGVSSLIEVCFDPDAEALTHTRRLGWLRVATDGVEAGRYPVDVQDASFLLPAGRLVTTLEAPCVSYPIRNVGEAPLTWRVDYPNWVRVTASGASVDTQSASERTLSPGEERNLLVCHRLADAQASVTGLIRFMNVTDGLSTIRTLRVRDHQAADDVLSVLEAGSDTPQCPVARRSIEALDPRYWAYEILPSVVSSTDREPIAIQVTAFSSDLDAIYLRPFHGFVGEDDQDLPDRIELNDRGEGLDAVSGDQVYTGGPIYYAGPSARTLSGQQYPNGIGVTLLGELRYESAAIGDGKFAVDPQLGVLDREVFGALSPWTYTGGRVAMSDRLINVCGRSRVVESRIRETSSDHSRASAQALTTEVYDHVGSDAFDFLTLMSTYHVERIEAERDEKVSRGSHTVVRNRVQGIGLPPTDDGRAYGSPDALLGINYAGYMNGLDTANVTHEMMHQWGVYLLKGTLSDGGDHYREAVGQASLLRGHHWRREGPNHVVDCSRLTEGLAQATDFDKYLMGLVPAEAVSPFMLSTRSDLGCGQVVPKGSIQTVNVLDDIVSDVGRRTPLPANVNYRMGFVAETLGRFLTPTEKVFYETFAKTYAAPVAEGAPLPVIVPGVRDELPGNWVSISKFFGEGFSLTTDIPAPGSAAMTQEVGSTLGPKIAPTLLGTKGVVPMGSQVEHVRTQDPTCLLTKSINECFAAHAAEDTHTNIRVTIHYTPLAADQFGGSTILYLKAVVALEEAKFAAEDSGVNITYELAHMEEVAYEEGPHITADLEALEAAVLDGASGPLAQVRRELEAHDGDIAILVTGREKAHTLRAAQDVDSYAGRTGPDYPAISNGAFWGKTAQVAVVEEWTLEDDVYRWELAGALGMNLGCFPQREVLTEEEQRLLPTTYGHALVLDVQNLPDPHYTLGGRPLGSWWLAPLYSSPDLTLTEGSRIGDPERADCVRALREIAPEVAHVDGRPTRQRLEVSKTASEPAMVVTDAEGTALEPLRYVLTNVDDHPLTWRAMAWRSEFSFAFEPSSEGSLAPGESVTVIVRPDHTRMSLPEPGRYETELAFLTRGFGAISIRPVVWSHAEDTGALPGPPQGESSIPSWVKNNAGWWAEGNIDDNSFLEGLKFLIEEKIIVVPKTAPGETKSDVIPDWFKDNASWWSQGIIRDDEFVRAIEHLIKEGILWVSTDDSGVSLVFASPEDDCFLGMCWGREAFAEEQQTAPKITVPEWVKNNAGWWAEGALEEDDFMEGIRFLIEDEIIKIPPTVPSGKTREDIPDWVKNGALWWSQDRISDGEFVTGIQFLIREGLMTIDPNTSDEVDDVREESNLPGDKLPPVEPIVWRTKGPGVQIGEVSVPINYDEPDAGTIKIVVNRRRATQEKKGVIVFNPGGPGASGVNFVDVHLPTLPLDDEIKAHFDLIGFDPRGTNQSAGVTCIGGRKEVDRKWKLVAEKNDLLSYPNASDQVYRDALLSELRKDYENCEGTDDEDLLGHMGTKNVARDLEQIRKAIGENQINYIGYSYGGIIGTMFAEMFPKSVRAMILDAPALPHYSNMETKLAKAESFEKVLDRFFTFCIDQFGCSEDFRKSFFALAGQLQNGPVSLSDKSDQGSDKTVFRLTGNHLYSQMVPAMYSHKSWPQLAYALSFALENNFRPLVVDLVVAQVLAFDWGSESHPHIRCIDQQEISEDEVVAKTESFRSKAPYFGDRLQVEGLYCHEWKYPRDPLPKTVNADAVDHPIMVVGGAFDPTTPGPRSKALYEMFTHAFYVESNHLGHTVLFSGKSSCVDGMAKKFLLNLTAGSGVTRCDAFDLESELADQMLRDGFTFGSWADSLSLEEAPGVDEEEPTVDSPSSEDEARWDNADTVVAETLAPSSSIACVAEVLAGRKKQGSTDHTLTESEFDGPEHLAIDHQDGSIYVADVGNMVIRKIDIAQDKVTTVAGNGKMGISLPKDYEWTRATKISLPQVRGLAVNPTNGHVFFTVAVDVDANGIIEHSGIIEFKPNREHPLKSELRLVAGRTDEIRNEVDPVERQGWDDPADPTKITFHELNALTVDDDGIVYVVDVERCAVYGYQEAKGVVAVLGFVHGDYPACRYRDGRTIRDDGLAPAGLIVREGNLKTKSTGLVYDESGQLYLSDYVGIRVLRAGTLTTVAGQRAQVSSLFTAVTPRSGYRDSAIPSSVRLQKAAAMALGKRTIGGHSYSLLYVIDAGDVRLVFPHSGATFTLDIEGETFREAFGTYALKGVALDAKRDTLYVSRSDTHQILKIENISSCGAGKWWCGGGSCSYCYADDPEACRDETGAPIDRR